MLHKGLYHSIQYMQIESKKGAYALATSEESALLKAQSVSQ